MKLIEVAETTEYKIFVDLDGVLADFQAGMEKAMSKVFGGTHVHDEDEYERSSKYRSKMWTGLRKYQDDHGGELWHELPLMPDAQQLWNYVKNYNTEILTATGNPEYGAGDQKYRWVAKHIDPNVKVNLTRKAAEKSQMAAPHHILIDDKMKAIKPWVDAGGIGVLHTSAANTIAQLKKLGL